VSIRDGSTANGLAQWLRRAAAASRTAALVDRIERRASAGWQRFTAPIEAAYPRSTPGRLAGRAVRATRHSFVYRWLTKEPDPAVIVIDLRETWTVGPIIATLEWVGTTRPVRWILGVSGSVGRRAGQTVRRAPVRLASVAILAGALAGLVLSWAGATAVERVAWLGAAALAALGLRVDASWADVADSRIGAWVRAVFEPPELEERDDDERH